MQRFLRALLMVVIAEIASSAIAAEILSGEARAGQVAARKVGQLAPALRLKTIDGNTIDLGALYGAKAVYLKFWATWCHDCRQQMPHFENTFRHEGETLKVIGVNIGFNDTLSDVQGFRLEQGLHMPLVIDDGSVAAAFDLRVTPMHVVIGRDGRIQHVGHLADAKLDRALVEAQRPATKAGSAHKVSEIRALKVGERVAPFTIASINAGANSSDALRIAVAKPGRPTVIAFIAAWCEWYLSETRAAVADRCRDVQDRLTNASVRYGDRADWIWIATGLWTTPDDLHQFASRYRVKVPIHLDEHGELFSRFDVHAVPTVVILDERGIMRERIADDARQIDAMLAQYLR